MNSKIYTINPAELVEKLSIELKPKLTLPKNHDIIKLSVANERAPLNPDWFSVRAASILRKIAVATSSTQKTNKSIKVKDLRSYYGKRINRGVKPNKHARAGQFVIVSAIEALKEQEFVNYDKNDGLTLTDKGSKFIDEVIEKKN